MLASEITGGVIYSGKCVLCGYVTDRYVPIVDGEVIEHATSYWDHNDLGRLRVCSGVTVSVMGRTAEEFRAVARKWRPAGW